MIINNFRSNYRNITFQTKITKKEIIDGKTVPYFKTPEGQTAVALNLQAIYNIKTNQNFTPKALEECDREILESNKPEDCKKWTNWVDPSSGRFYTIIKKSDNPDGTKTVRILGKNGELIKECDITPKKIIIIDNPNFKIDDSLHSKTSNLMGHGPLVKLVAERTNPIADVETLLLNDKSIEKGVVKKLQEVLKRLKHGEQIDAINLSLETIKIIQPEEASTNRKSLSSAETTEILARASKTLRFPDKHYIKKIPDLMTKINQYGTRIIISAGNAGANGHNILSAIDCTEPVGGLGTDGKIAKDSSSRNLTTHYEQYNFPITFTEDGLRITENKGVDIPYPKHYAKLVGQKAEGNIITKEKLEQLCKEIKPGDEIYIDKIKNGLLLLKKDEIEIKGVLYPIYANLADEESIKAEQYLTATPNGTLIPLSYLLSPVTEISGTSLAAPKRAAKLMLNDAIQEILHSDN